MEKSKIYYFFSVIFFLYIVLTSVNIVYDKNYFEGLGKNYNKYENILVTVSLVLASCIFAVASFENPNLVVHMDKYVIISMIFYFSSGLVYLIDKEVDDSKIPTQGILNMLLAVFLILFAYFIKLKQVEIVKNSAKTPATK